MEHHLVLDPMSPFECHREIENIAFLKDFDAPKYQKKIKMFIQSLYDFGLKIMQSNVKLTSISKARRSTYVDDPLKISVKK